jgi:FAD/FMN-containing dehydrogenase
MNPKTAPSPETWTNWVGNQQCRPRHIVRAEHDDDILHALARARRDRAHVRVAASGHSFSPLVPTDGTILDLSGMTGITALDTARSRVTVAAGSRISQLGAPLWDAGLSLLNQGDIDSQQLGGAISTATHGSGLQTTSLSGAVRGARLLLADGTERVVDENDPLLPSVQVSLGTLGVITHVDLQVGPAYNLAERIESWSYHQAIEQFDDYCRRYRHFSFFWGPHPHSLAIYGLGDARNAPDTCHVKMYEELPPDSPAADSPQARRVDRAYRIYPAHFEKNFHELEYFVPFELGVHAVAVVRELMRTRHNDQSIPVELRAIGPDNGHLSPMSGAPTASISVAGAPGTDYWPFLRDVDRALQQFAARAHWGKLHFLTRERTAALYPRYAEFIGARRDLDPTGLFLNPHTAELLA